MTADKVKYMQLQGNIFEHKMTGFLYGLLLDFYIRSRTSLTIRI